MRATNGVARHRKKNRILKKTKGYWGRRHLLLRLGIEAIKNADKYAYRDRKRRKREFRSLWITRIAAAARMNGLNYSLLISGLTKAGIAIDRKQLSELAVNQPAGFAALCEQAKAAVPAERVKAVAEAGVGTR
ncbi:MAG TPA: 50S ribosomal protein L20 [Planctomycetota bacterium]|nr:50S ribosomal protein L20 [Planctomycetota bacterium]